VYTLYPSDKGKPSLRKTLRFRQALHCLRRIGTSVERSPGWWRTYPQPTEIYR
jgi:hypothetical protein